MLMTTLMPAVPIIDVRAAIIVELMIIIIITTINMTIIIYITSFLCVGQCLDVYISTSITVHYHISCLKCMILLLINFHHNWISLMSTQ